MCSGVVPQQPPSSDAPPSASFFESGANSSGDTWNSARPLTITGSPAFGFTAIGTLTVPTSAGRNSSNCFGPSPQLKPTASAPSDSATVAAATTSAPVSSLPVSSNVIVAMTGSAQASFAASSAAFNS